MASMPDVVVSVQVDQAAVALTQIGSLCSGASGRGMTSPEKLRAIEQVVRQALASLGVRDV